MPPAHTLPPSQSFHVVDLQHAGTTLTVQWRSAPGAHARPIDAATLARIAQHVATLGKAERRAGLARDVVAPNLVAPAGPGLATAQRALGVTLFDLLDGPDRALARRLDDARRHGTTLHLVVCLRAADRKALAQHPALGWHLQLVAAPDGPLALAPNVTIAVQLEDAEITARETVPDGRLQVLFMAYSPHDVHPVLDYEAEEERILGELAPFVEERRLFLKVGRGRQPRRAQAPPDVPRLRCRPPDRPWRGHAPRARFVMEDATGDRDDVSAEQLLKTLRAGRAMPRLLVISSCHSAE
jgi:hypothetical protein